jgi:hypothetical protein
MDEMDFYFHGFSVSRHGFLPMTQAQCSRTKDLTCVEL